MRTDAADASKKPLTALCLLSMSLSAMAMTGLGLLLPGLAEKLSIGLAAGGSVFTANFAGYTAFALLGGALAGRFGKKRLLLLSLAGFAAASAAVPLAGSLAALIPVVFLYGGATGVMQVMANAMQTDLHPGRPAYSMSLNGAFFGAGAVCMPLASTVLPAGSALSLFAVFAALSALLAACLLFVPVPRAGSAGTAFTLADLRALASDRRLWLVTACLFLYTGAESSIWGWLSTFLKQRLAFTLIQSGVAMSVFWTAMSLGRYACGLLSRRVSAASLVSALCLSSFAAVALTGLVSSAAAYWALIALTGFSLSGISPLLLAHGADGRVSDQARPAAYAMLMALGNLGIAVIPWVTGFVGEKAGIQAAMMGPSVLFLCILIILFVAGRRQASISQSS